MSFAKPAIALIPPLLLLGLSAAALLLDPFGAASALRGRLFDAYDTARTGPSDSGVELVTLDSGSLARYGRWPWPDQGLAALTRAASGAGAIVFATPLDRPESHGFPAPLQSVPAVVPVLLGVGGLIPHPLAHFEYQGRDNPFGAVPGFSTGAGPRAAVASTAQGIGAANLIPDRDGVVRRMPLVFRLGRQLIPSLSAEAARLAAGDPALIFVGDEADSFSLRGGGVGIAGFARAGRIVPTDRDGRFWLDFSRPPEQISADALLSQELAPEALKNKILVLDTPDDLVVTPLGLQTRAAVIAQGIQNLVAGTVLERPSFAPAIELLGLLLASGVALFLMVRLRSHWAALFVGITLAAAFYASWFAYVRARLLFDPATPGIGLLLVFLAADLMRALEIARARSSLRMAFSDSLPRALVEKIVHHPSLLSVEGETRTITYLVCGVRGLTELAASLCDDPKSFTRIMQDVMTPLMDLALAHGGTIDRLTADGFAAFWNAPLEDGEHAMHACEAANDMPVIAARVSERIALERGESTRPPLEIGVGVATGAAIAGGFGGSGRMGYSVHGGVVHLAGRIQALAPQYGPAVIVAEQTQAAATRGFAFLEVDYIAAGERDAPVKLYALVGNPGVRASPKFRALMAFHDHIFSALRRQQWAKARALIAQCRNLSGANQGLYDLHLRRIGYFESNPPGPEWDGAFRPILK
jgi:adenylate cyclase